MFSVAKIHSLEHTRKKEDGDKKWTAHKKNDNPVELSVSQVYAITESVCKVLITINIGDIL